ncbi:MAG: hypothetical protein OEM28_07635 [Nitrosopumilus sp.]|nr:hypothetical protein [Nitrosopumilus sp.]MDH3486854.1 hypothetical protein [Nitrosopumilus sp.]
MGNDNDLEYILLRNYLELTNTSRGLLLRMDFDALEKIESNTWFHKFEGEDIEKGKRIVKSIIQQEIIAKIMIYIEDLAIISESLSRGVNYYTLLDKKETPEGIQDVGDILKEFFESIDKLSQKDFSKIMSLGNPEGYAINGEEKQLLEKALEFEKEEYTKTFKKLKDFGTEHHAVFRRYKHAGFYSKKDGYAICTVEVKKNTLNLCYSVTKKDIITVNSFVKDLTGKGHWGIGNYMSEIKTEMDIEKSIPLIEKVHNFKVK